MSTVREHLEHAQQLARSGNLAAAIELCHRIRLAAPDEPAVAALEASLLLEAGRAGEALPELEQLSVHHPSPGLWANLALAYHRVGQSGQARSACLRAIDLQPTQRAANLTLAAVHVEEGEHSEAVACYERILERDPACVAARAGLAAALLETGRAHEALEAAQRASAEDPQHAGARITMAAAFARLGLLREAEAAAREAVLIHPGNTESHALLAEVLVALARGREAIPHLEAVLAAGDEKVRARAREIGAALRDAVPEMIGNVRGRRHALGLLQDGRTNEAADAFRCIVRNDPDDWHARFGLGLAMAALDKYREALGHFDAAIAMQPALARFHDERGRALIRLGRAKDALAAFAAGLLLEPDNRELLLSRARLFVELGEHIEALRALRTMLIHYPEDALARGLLVGVLLEQGDDDEAERQLEELRKHAPEDPIRHLQEGRLHQRRGDFAESLAAFDRAIAGRPREPEFHVQRGLASVEAHEFQAALQDFDRAIALDSGHHRARFNRATTQLLLGNFEEGLKDYGHRWYMREASRPVLSTPRWKGEDLAGRTLLVFSEQGLGDSFMFARLLPALGRLDGRVLLRPHRPLAHFFHNFPGVDELLPGVPDDRLDSVPHDVHVPLADLMAILGVERDTIPPPAVYPVQEERIARWREWLEERPGLRVGVAWQGNPRYFADRLRSVRLELFEPLARIDNVRLIGLQKGPGRSQIGALAERFPLDDLGLLLDNDGCAFADTAAAMRCLDLIVATDSAIVHLAGSLGVPCWTLLAHTPEWRWGIEGDSTPWYPSMRLYRQRRWGDWQDVMRRVAEDLEKFAAQKRAGR